jgi:hypothetical protein
MNHIGRRLEQYTEQHPKEVLLVAIEVDGKADQIAIYKGFSSSLMCPTSFDPDVPVIPESAVIQQIDRLESPYNPNNPRFIEQNLSWERFARLMERVGV